METSQALPLHAVHDDDLADVVRGDPPFVSIYLRTEPDVENAAQRSEVRWKNLRGELEGQEVAQEILEWVDEVVPDAHQAGEGLAVIADSRGVRLIDHGPLQEIEERGVVGDAPVLSPVVRWRQEQPTALVVLTDRRGADIFALRRSDPDVQRSVEGDDYPLRKVRPGGWSQRRYQERAENTWEENAQEVAAVVHRLADRVEPRVIAIGGDVRAVTLVQDSLRDDLRKLVHVVPGERPWDGIGDAIPDEVHEVIADVVHADGEAMVERLREELGQRDLAVEGLNATVDALAQARVAALLIADVGDARLWMGADPMQVAAKPADLRALGVDDPREVGAVDALIRAALASGAGVRLYDTRDPDGPLGLDPAQAPRDGVGALLRWAGGGPS
jgi:hypothetical protein